MLLRGYGMCLQAGAVVYSRPAASASGGSLWGNQMRSKKLLIAMLLIGLYISLSPLVAMADPNASPSPQKPECNPRARMLATLMGDDVDCLDLMDLQAEGIGFGVIMKAYSLSQTFDLDWEDLVESHRGEEGLGWGQIMKAHFLASRLGVEAEELLEEREKGVGWGQILKKHAKGPGKPSWAGPNHNERT